MTGRPARVVLLGPQRDNPDLGRVLDDLEVGGPVALITAGRQEWEDDDGRLKEAVGRDAFNLQLYGRADEVWREDPELAHGHRALQRQVRLLRRVYNVRLDAAMEAWSELQQMAGEGPLLDQERDAARRAVQDLDAYHARRLGELRDGFYHRFDPLMRASVARQRDEVRRALAPAAGVVVAGGHVPLLLNRLRLFGVDHLLAGKTVVAYSGGAMALTRYVVLFHDSPPWGPGHAEVGEVGLGLVPGVVALPDGSSRLRLDDRGRVSRLAQRFEPDVCVVLDPGSRVDWDGSLHAHGARRLTPDGWPQSWQGAA